MLNHVKSWNKQRMRPKQKMVNFNHIKVKPVESKASMIQNILKSVSMCLTEGIKVIKMLTKHFPHSAPS